MDLVYNKPSTKEWHDCKISKLVKMISKIALLVVCCLAFVNGYGSSFTSLSKPHQGKFKYDIEHSHHGHWHGSAHPHGYGGLGDNYEGHSGSSGDISGGSHGSHGHGSSHTSFSKPHQGKFNYDIDHHYHGHWHGDSHPHGYGGL